MYNKLIILVNMGNYLSYGETHQDQFTQNKSCNKNTNNLSDCMKDYEYNNNNVYVPYYFDTCIKIRFRYKLDEKVFNNLINVLYKNYKPFGIYHFHNTEINMIYFEEQILPYGGNIERLISSISALISRNIEDFNPFTNPLKVKVIALPNQVSNPEYNTNENYIDPIFEYLYWRYCCCIQESIHAYVCKFLPIDMIEKVPQNKIVKILSHQGHNWENESNDEKYGTYYIPEYDGYGADIVVKFIMEKQKNVVINKLTSDNNIVATNA